MKKFTKILLGISLSIAMVISGCLALGNYKKTFAKSLVIDGYGIVTTNSANAEATIGTYKQLNCSTEFTGLRLTGKTGATFKLGSVDIGSSDWAGTYSASGAPSEQNGTNTSLIEFAFDPHDNNDFPSASATSGSGELSYVDFTFTQGNDAITIRVIYARYEANRNEFFIRTKAGNQSDFGTYRYTLNNLHTTVRKSHLYARDFANLGYTGSTDKYLDIAGNQPVAIPVYYDFNDVALYSPVGFYSNNHAQLSVSYLIRDYNSTEAKYNSTTSNVTTWNGFKKASDGSCVVEVSATFGEVFGESASSVIVTKLGNKVMGDYAEATKEITVKNVGGSATFGNYKQVTSGEYAGVRLTGVEGSTFNLGSINLQNTYFDDNWAYVRDKGVVNADTQTTYSKLSGTYYTGGNSVVDGANSLARSFMTFVYDPSTTANLELMNFTVTLTEEDKPENFVTYHVLGYTDGGVTKELLIKATATNNSYIANERFYKTDGIRFDHQVRRTIDCRGAQPKPVGLYFDYSQNSAYTDVAYSVNYDGIYGAFRVRDFDAVTNTSDYYQNTLPSGISYWEGFSKEDANVNVTVTFNEIVGASETSIILTSFGGYTFGNQTLCFDENVKVIKNDTVDLNNFAGYKTPTVTLAYNKGIIAKYSVNNGEKFTNSKYTFGEDKSYVIKFYDSNDVLLGQTIAETTDANFKTPTVVNGAYKTYRNGSEIFVDNETVQLQDGDEIRFYPDVNAITGLPYVDVRVFTLNGTNYPYDTNNVQNAEGLPLTYNAENVYYSLLVDGNVLNSAVIDISCNFDNYCDVTIKEDSNSVGTVYYKWSTEKLSFPVSISGNTSITEVNNKSLVGYARKDIGVDYETKETAIREDGFTYAYKGNTKESSLGLIYYANIELGDITHANVKSNKEIQKAYSLVKGMVFEKLYIGFNVDYAIKIEENATGVDDNKSGLRFYVEVDKEDWAKFKFYSRETNNDGKSEVAFYNYITTQSQLDKAGVTDEPKTFGTKWMSPSWNPTLGKVNGLGLTCISKNGESYDASNVQGAKGAFMFYGLAEASGDMWLDDKFNKNNATCLAYAFVIRNFTDVNQTYVFAPFFSASYLVGGNTSLMQIPLKVNLKTVCQEKFNSIVLNEKPSGIYYSFMVNGVKKYSKYTKKHVLWLNEKGGLENEII